MFIAPSFVIVVAVGALYVRYFGLPTRQGRTPPPACVALCD
jgi:hypothetical protein